MDINPEIVKVAKEYFGFLEDEKVKSVIADAYQYVLDYSQPKFDMIFMDVNYEEGNLHLSPPLKFLDPKFLAKLVVSIPPLSLTFWYYNSM